MRFTADDAENYGSSGSGGFFSLKNDKEVKQVRLLYNRVEDIEGVSVHKVKVTVDNKESEHYVNCLRNYNDSVDVCPFCAAKMAVQARLIIPLYNIDEDKVQIWDRGKTMFGKLTSLCSRYATKRNLVNNIFEIERNGKPKDQKTTYEFYQIEADDTEIEDLPEVPEFVNSYVWDKTAEDMEYYLETGEFPPTEDEAEDTSVRRRQSSRESSSRDEDTGRSSRATTRRTPARSQRKDPY